MALSPGLWTLDPVHFPTPCNPNPLTFRIRDCFRVAPNWGKQVGPLLSPPLIDWSSNVGWSQERSMPLGEAGPYGLWRAIPGKDFTVSSQWPALPAAEGMAVLIPQWGHLGGTPHTHHILQCVHCFSTLPTHQNHGWTFIKTQRAGLIPGLLDPNFLEWGPGTCVL